MEKGFKFILRIISYPFFLGLLLIALIKSLFVESYKWFLYGGEFVVANKDTKQTIADLFTLVEKDKEPKKIQCKNCDEIVIMTPVSDCFCPNCFC